MSNCQYIFLPKARVPDRDELQAAIDKLDLPLKLHPEFTPFTDEGFSPCTLLGKEGPGFEIFYEPATDVAGDDEGLRAIAAQNEYCISLVWRGSEEDLACVTIVSAAFAVAFGAVVSYEGDTPESGDTLLHEARRLVQELSSPKPQVTEQSDPAPEQKSEPRTVRLTISGLSGGKTITRTYKGGKLE